MAKLLYLLVIITSGVSDNGAHSLEETIQTKEYPLLI